MVWMFNQQEVWDQSYQWWIQVWQENATHNYPHTLYLVSVSFPGPLLSFKTWQVRFLSFSTEFSYLRSFLYKHLTLQSYFISLHLDFSLWTIAHVVTVFQVFKISFKNFLSILLDSNTFKKETESQPFTDPTHFPTFLLFAYMLEAATNNLH